MTEQATIGAFAHKLALLENWAAWKLGERESAPLVIPEATTLDEAVSDALLAIAWYSGDILAVQHSHAGRRKFTLWLFTVRKSTRNGGYREARDGGRPVFVGRMEAKPVSQVALAEPFSPVLRFDAFRDDASGVDRTLVEVRPSADITEGGVG